MSQTAFITGVSGFVGAHLARHLLNNGWTVHGTVRRRSCPVEDVRTHTLEIDDVSALRSVIQLAQPERVYHLAAIVNTVTTPSAAQLHRVNVLGTVALLEALDGGSHSCHVLYASSSFAYGRTSPSDQPVSELAPCIP